MKIFLILLLILSLNVFASSVCDFDSTIGLVKASKRTGDSSDAYTGDFSVLEKK